MKSYVPAYPVTPKKVLYWEIITSIITITTIQTSDRCTIDFTNLYIYVLITTASLQNV